MKCIQKIIKEILLFLKDLLDQHLQIYEILRFY